MGRSRPNGLSVTEVDDGGYDCGIVLLQSSLPRPLKALYLFRRALVEGIDQLE
jgi:hypothetical protein